MKTLIILAASAALASTALAQGRVQFANTSATLITTNEIWPQTAQGPMSGAGQYIAGLFVGAAGSGFSSLWPVAYATNSTLAGRFSGGANLVLPGGFDGSATIAFQVRAWSKALGFTWSDVVFNTFDSYDGTGNAFSYSYIAPPGKCYLGCSTIGYVTPAMGLGVSSALFGTAPGQIGGFVMEEVFSMPEPSTAALAGLALGGLVILRRRPRPLH
jgi:hypothetical protein